MTITVLLLLVTLLLVIAAALGRVPLWVAVLVLVLIHLLAVLPR